MVEIDTISYDRASKLISQIKDIARRELNDELSGAQFSSSNYDRKRTDVLWVNDNYQFLLSVPREGKAFYGGFTRRPIFKEVRGEME